MALCIQSFHNPDTDGERAELQLPPPFPMNNISISKSSRLLHTIPPSYIILLNHTTVFLALPAQNHPSTVCQELAAAMASSAGRSLAQSLGWHDSSVLTKWRPSAAVWMLDDQLARFERLSASGASSWEMRLCAGTTELPVQWEAFMFERHRTRTGQRSPYAMLD